MKKNNNRNHVIEKYRVLRNCVENYNKEGVKCISVTSNSEVEGKATIARNLAMSLAIYGKKTLFVDCDLGDKTKIQSFDAASARGLINILKDISKLKDQQLNRENINEISLKSYVKETSCEYLSIASLGEYSLDSYSLMFKTEYLKVVMEILKKKFHYIIVDAPSFTNLSYTQVITGATDGCLFVLKEGVNEVTEGVAIKDKINTIGCKMLGCVLNKEKKTTNIFDKKFNSLFDSKYTSIKNRVPINDKTSIST